MQRDAGADGRSDSRTGMRAAQPTTRRAALALTASGLGALAGCSGSGGTGAESATRGSSPTSPADTRWNCGGSGSSDRGPAAFVAALLPTAAVQTVSGPDIWQPWRVKLINEASFGWQVPYKQSRRGYEFVIPGRVLVGASGPAAIPTDITVTTNALGTGLRPPCRGSSPELGDSLDLPMQAPEWGEATGSSDAYGIGSLELSVAFNEDGPVADLVDGDTPSPTARSPSSSIGAVQGDKSLGGAYGFVEPPSDKLAAALEEGYRDLRTLYSFANLLFSAGLSAVGASGNVVFQFIADAAESEVKSRFKSAVADGVAAAATSSAEELGIISPAGMLTADGERVEGPTREQLGDARVVEGSVFLPPSTAAQHRALDIDDIREGNENYGYENHELSEDDVERVALGFSGPFVSVSPGAPETPTPTPEPGPAISFREDWEDGNLTEPAWTVSEDVEVVAESAPDGGGHSLRMFSDARRRRARTVEKFRWDAPWTVDGLFRPDVGDNGEPPGYRLAHNISLVGGKVSIRVEGPGPNNPFTNAKLTGDLLNTDTARLSLPWEAGNWHRYRVRYDGGATYQFLFWNAFRDREQAETASTKGEAPSTQSHPLGYFFYSGDPQAVHHAHIYYRTDAATV